MVKVKHYLFVFNPDDEQSVSGNSAEVFVKIDNYYKLENINTFFQNNQNFKDNKNFTEYEIQLLAVPSTVNINLDDYEIIYNNKKKEINNTDTNNEEKINDDEIKRIIYSVNKTISKINILFVNYNNISVGIINKNEKKNIVNDIKIDKNKVINHFNLLRKKIYDLIDNRGSEFEKYTPIKEYPIKYDFNINYNKLITHIGNIKPLLNKIYLIDKNVYIGVTNLNEFNYNTFFCPSTDFIFSPEPFISLFYNLKKMNMFYKYISKVFIILNDAKYNDTLEKIEDFCNIKLEELKNKKIITYLKINNTNPLKTINEKRYRIFMDDTKKKMLLKYNTDNVQYYDSYGYLKQLDVKTVELKAKEATNNIQDYLLGNFTKILLPEESNSYISEKYMQPIINNLIEGKPVFIFGYGTSGSGKTSSLIYYRDVLDSNKNENGIISNLCLKTIQEFKTTKNINIGKIKLSFEEISKDQIIKLGRPLFFDANLKYISYDIKSLNMVDIKHEYRFNEIVNNPNYSSLFSIFEFDTDNIIYYYKSENTLPEIVQYLVDTDRHVKATLNNPQSSRSHVLIYVEFYANNNANSNANSNANAEQPITTLIVGDFAGVESNFECNSKDVLEKMLNIENTITKKPFYYTLNDYNTNEEFGDMQMDVNNVNTLDIEIQNFINNEKNKELFFIKDNDVLKNFTNKIIDVCVECVENKKNVEECINKDSPYNNDLINLISIDFIDFTQKDYTTDDITKYLLSIIDHATNSSFNIIQYISKIKIKGYINKIFYDLPIILNNIDNIKQINSNYPDLNNVAEDYKKKYNDYKSHSKKIKEVVNKYIQKLYLNHNSITVINETSSIERSNIENLIKSFIEYLNKISNIITDDIVNNIKMLDLTRIYADEIIDIYIKEDKSYKIIYTTDLFPPKYIPIIHIKKNKIIYDILQKFKYNFIEKKKDINSFNSFKLKTKPNTEVTNVNIIEFIQDVKPENVKTKNSNDYTLLSNYLINIIQKNEYVNDLQFKMVYDLIVVQTFFIPIKQQPILINGTGNISINNENNNNFNNLLYYYYLTIKNISNIEQYVNLIFNKYNKIINSCLLRNNEGDFINRSLFNLNNDIIEITKKNMNIQGSENKNFYDSFLLKNCNYEKNINKVQSSHITTDNENNIIKLIKHHCNYIEDFEKNIIFCIIGFFNISSLTDNPPKVNYSDDLILFQQALDVLNDTPESFLSAFTKDINTAISRYPFLNLEFNDSETSKESISKIINFIKKNNNYTTLGTLEYMDKMSKFNVTENICLIKELESSTNENELIHNGIKFHSLDYFSNLF